MPQSFIFIFDLLESGLRTSRPPRREWRRSRWNIDVGIEGGTRNRRRVSDARGSTACGLWTATHRFAYHRVTHGSDAERVSRRIAEPLAARAGRQVPVRPSGGVPLHARGRPGGGARRGERPEAERDRLSPHLPREEHERPRRSRADTSAIPAVP